MLLDVDVKSVSDPSCKGQNTDHLQVNVQLYQSIIVYSDCVCTQVSLHHKPVTRNMGKGAEYHVNRYFFLNETKGCMNILNNGANDTG